MLEPFAKRFNVRPRRHADGEVLAHDVITRGNFFPRLTLPVFFEFKPTAGWGFTARYEKRPYTRAVPTRATPVANIAASFCKNSLTHGQKTYPANNALTTASATRFGSS